MSTSESLDRLDRAKGGEFWYRHAGVKHIAPSPVDLTFEGVLVALMTEKVPGTPNMPLFKRDHLFERWAAHYDLPPFGAAQRLAFLLDRYADDLTYDLRVHAQVDLGVEWRSRRWRTLLAIIDRLPPHCYYAEAVSKDPEHAKALARAMAAAPGAEDAGPPRPAQRIWTPEVQMMTKIYDAIRHLDWTVLATNVGRKAPEPPKPSPGPHSLLEGETRKAEYERKMTAHKALTKRLLPHKRD